MKMILLFLLPIVFSSCSVTKKTSTDYQEITITSLQPTGFQLPENASFRGLSVHNNEVVIGGSPGLVGVISPDGNLRMHELGESASDYRAVANSGAGYFALSAGNPAVLYKGSEQSPANVVVYNEEGDKVFYDSMNFWNTKEGIAFGDEMNGCMSVIITRDGGENWRKLPCNQLPVAKSGEGAFAASNTNIAIVGDKTWLASGTAIYYSPDKGENWERFSTPIRQKQPTQGIYSIDFYNEKTGIAIGGDYTKPESNDQNLLLTTDGGKTWSIISRKYSPGYRSCIQFVPNSNAKGLLAVGFNGIDYSRDGGITWKHLSDESFYSFRFLNETQGVLVGKEKIATFQLDE